MTSTWLGLWSEYGVVRLMFVQDLYLAAMFLFLFLFIIRAATCQTLVDFSLHAYIIIAGGASSWGYCFCHWPVSRIIFQAATLTVPSVSLGAGSK